MEGIRVRGISAGAGCLDWKDLHNGMAPHVSCDACFLDIGAGAA